MADESAAQVLDTRKADFGIDEEETKRIKRHAGRFVKLFQRSVLEGWELGRELRQAKLKLPHGYFTPWVETQIGLPRRTAQRLMDLYARDPEKRHVTHFNTTAEALRLLPPPKSQSTDVGAPGGGAGKGSPGKAKAGKPSKAGADLGTGIARLEPILREMLDSTQSPGDEDLQALIGFTTLAARAVDRQLKRVADANGFDVELSEEVVRELRGVLETVTNFQQDEQGKLT